MLLQIYFYLGLTGVWDGCTLSLVTRNNPTALGFGGNWASRSGFRHPLSGWPALFADQINPYERVDTDS